MDKTYTRRILGAELILKLEKGFSVEQISNWADELRIKHIGNTDKIVDDVIQDLSAMNFGEEFEMTKKELNDLAIKLIQEK